MLPKIEKKEKRGKSRGQDTASENQSRKARKAKRVNTRKSPLHVLREGTSRKPKRKDKTTPDYSIQKDFPGIKTKRRMRTI
jgi:hypothetical protein